MSQLEDVRHVGAALGSIREAVAQSRARKERSFRKQKCPFCDRTFNSRTDWLGHISFQHRDETGQPDHEETPRSELEYITDVHRYLFGTTDNPDTSDEGLVKMHEHLVSKIRQSPLDFLSVSRKESEWVSKKFNSKAHIIEFKLNNLGMAACLIFFSGLQLVASILKFMLDDLNSRHNSKSDYFVQFTIVSGGNALDRPITSSYMTPTSDSIARFLAEISLVMTSKTTIFLDDVEELKVIITTIGHSPKTEADAATFGYLANHNMTRKKVATQQEYLYRRAGVIWAPNVTFKCDCLLVACVIGLNYINGLYRKGLKPIHKDFPRLRRQVLELAQHFPKTDFSKQQGHSMCFEVQQILNSNFDCQLIIYKSDELGSTFFKGEPAREASRQIPLLLLGNHLGFIKNPESFFKVKHCPTCVLVYPARTVHKCYGTKIEEIYMPRCSRCHSLQCDQAAVKRPKGIPRQCPSCHGFYYSL